MRAIFLSMVLLTFLNANAGTKVDISPWNPVRGCSDTPDKLKNRIESFDYTESDSLLQIEFTTFYYHVCENNVPVNFEIEEGFFFQIWKEGWNWPWTKSPFQSEAYDLDSIGKRLTVNFTIDKTEFFKENKLRLIDIQFYPAPFKYRDLDFLWRLELERIDELKTKIRFQ